MGDLLRTLAVIALIFVMGYAIAWWEARRRPDDLENPDRDMIDW